jgi:hypothetical protein
MENENILNEQTAITSELKQTFLSNAITDIATCIQLADTKVSIIMGSFIALFVGILACHEPIFKAVSSIKPCSWRGMILIIFILLFLLSAVGVFAFGILTIRGHNADLVYKSKWFLPQSVNEYSFDRYKNDLRAMTDSDIIENMGAELYKLNDINRQKAKSTKWTIRCFTVALSTIFLIALFLLISVL